MKKLIGITIAAAVTFAPATAAFAEKGSREGARRSSRPASCAVDAGVLSRTVNAQVFCGGQASNSNGSKGKEKARRGDSRRSSCTLDLGVLTRTVRAQALCSR
jgi:hypothetical protein